MNIQNKKTKSTKELVDELTPKVKENGKFEKCPNGYRFNKTTRKCMKNKAKKNDTEGDSNSDNNIQDKKTTQEQPDEITPKIKKNGKYERCPNGFRFNKTTKKCTKNKTYDTEKVKKIIETDFIKNIKVIPNTENKNNNESESQTKIISPIIVNNKRKRCPNGFNYDKTIEKCRLINKKND